MFYFLYHYKDFYLTRMYRSNTSGYLIRSRNCLPLAAACVPPSPRFFVVGSTFCFFLCVFLLFVLTFRVPCCDGRYDFRIKTIFGSSFPRVDCSREHVLFTLFVFVWHSGVQPILCCFFALIFFFCGLSFFDCPLCIVERLFALLGHLR